MTEKKYFPVDIFAVKKYGVEKWQKEFFWPVSDHDFANLCTGIEECLIRHINTQPEEISDLLLIQYSLRSEYWHFLHALKVADKVRASGKEILYSDNTLWYKEIMAGGPIAVRGFRKGKVKYKLTKRIKSEIARLVWRVHYNDIFVKFLRPKEKRQIVEIFGAVVPLMKMHIKNSSCTYKFTSEKNWQSGDSENVPEGLISKIGKVSGVIAGELTQCAGNNGTELSGNHTAYLRELTEKMLIHTAELTQSIKKKIDNKTGIRLLTSSFVGLFPRALCVSVRKKGGHVTTFNHGYDIGIHDTPSQSFLEFPVSDEFVTYNRKSIEFMEAIRNNHTTLRNNRVTISSCDYNPLAGLWRKNINKPVPKNIKKVMFIGYPHNQFRKYFAPATLSPIQLDFELRIIDFLKKSGYDIFYKAHPERLREVKGIFEDKAKVLGGAFRKHMNKADAFIFGSIRTAAFPEALCTSKPVIGINLDCEHSTDLPEAMEILRKRCRFIHAKFDERNRIIFDKNELKTVLSRKPEQPDNEFIEKYLFPTTSVAD